LAAVFFALIDWIIRFGLQNVLSLVS
jgi:hypothetical protein